MACLDSQESFCSFLVKSSHDFCNDGIVHLHCYFCRHILASLHFNENIQRDTQVSKEGKEYMRVTYPKFKLGEEVVREVAGPPTYG